MEKQDAEWAVFERAAKARGQDDIKALFRTFNHQLFFVLSSRAMEDSEERIRLLEVHMVAHGERVTSQPELWKLPPGHEDRLAPMRVPDDEGKALLWKLAEMHQGKDYKPTERGGLAKVGITLGILAGMDPTEVAKRLGSGCIDALLHNGVSMELIEQAISKNEWRVFQTHLSPSPKKQDLCVRGSEQEWRRH